MLILSRDADIPDDIVFTGFASGDPMIRMSVEDRSGERPGRASPPKRRVASRKGFEPLTYGLGMARTALPAISTDCTILLLHTFYQ